MMELEKQVTSLEISKRLKELGVKQESLFYWVENFRGIQLSGKDNVNIEWSIHPSSNIGNWSAFTVSELGEMLPSGFKFKSKSFYIAMDCDKNIFYEDMPKTEEIYSGQGDSEDTEANSRAKMLIYLIENKLIEV